MMIEAVIIHIKGSYNLYIVWSDHLHPIVLHSLASMSPVIDLDFGQVESIATPSQFCIGTTEQNSPGDIAAFGLNLMV